MSKRNLILLAAIAIVLMSATCTRETSAVKAGLDEKFSLSVLQSARIEGEGLQIKFLEVTNDSRCPINVTCIWQGEANSLVEITYRESLHRVTLSYPGLTSEPARQTFEEYEITFKLDPYPEAGKKLAQQDYLLWLTVSKKPQLSGAFW